jgi:hypothetical protein
MDSTVVFLSGLPSYVTRDQVAFRLCLYGPYQSLELFESNDGLVARVDMKTPTQAQLLMTRPPSFWDDARQTHAIGAESLAGQALAEVWEAQRHGPRSLPGDAA